MYVCSTEGAKPSIQETYAISKKLNIHYQKKLIKRGIMFPQDFLRHAFLKGQSTFTQGDHLALSKQKPQHEPMTRVSTNEWLKNDDIKAFVQRSAGRIKARVSAGHFSDYFTLVDARSSCLFHYRLLKLSNISDYFSSPNVCTKPTSSCRPCHTQS